MGLAASRLATTLTVALAAAVLVADVAGALLLASEVPYLGAVEVGMAPAVGAGYAAAAAYVALTSRRARLAAAPLLVAAGLGAHALSLGLARTSGAWVVIGTVELWLPTAVLAMAVLALRGELTDRLTRACLLATATLALVGSLVRVVTYDPAAWDWCRCMANPVAVVSSPDAWLVVEPWLTAMDGVAVALALLAVGSALTGRPGRLGAAEIAVAVGLLAWGAARLFVAIWSLVALGAAPARVGLVGVGGLILVLAGFLVRAVRRRPSRAHVADLLLAAREEADPAGLRELVARALGQPEAVVLWWDRDARTYRDHHGDVVVADVFPHVLRVESDGRPIALVVSNHALSQDPTVLEPIAEALRLSTENRRLAQELRASLAQVRESRARILTSSDETRKRIERDLHDGAQQLLISTGAKLNLASAHVDPDTDRELAQALGDASDELGRALAELRQLASGITPTALVHGELGDALEELTMRSAIPVALHVTGDRTVDPEVSATIYFVVAECLTNVAKHAAADSVQVDVSLADPVRVTIADNGRGGADPVAGTGLRGLVDRVEARGGRLDVRTSELGTTVTVAMPAGSKDPER